MPVSRYFSRFSSRLQESSFARNALTLVSATVVTQALSALTAPVLGRLFSPEDYGLLGLFMAVTTLGGVFSTLQYVRAILLPADDADAAGLVQLSVMVCGGLSLVCVVPCWLLREQIGQALGAPALEAWLPLAPVTIFTGGVGTALSAWANRRQQYRALARSRVASLVVGSVISIGGGLISPTPAVLIGSYMIGQASAGVWLLAAASAEERHRLRAVELGQVRSLFLRYRNFALMTTPTEFVNNFINQVPLFLLTSLSGPAAVGLFNMTNRLLGLPNQFIAGALSEVFQQRAASDYATTGTCRPIYVKTARTLALTGLLPMLGLLLFGPWLFRFYLGPEWTGAGEFARVMAVLYFFRLVVSPISYVFFVAERQREDLILHLVMVALVVGCMYLAGKYSDKEIYIISAYTFSYCIIYIYYLIRGYFISQNAEAVVSA